MRFRFTSMNFAKNQLSLGLISLSPLPTNHLSILQHTRVPSSKRAHPFFNVFIGSSPSFGSSGPNDSSSNAYRRLKQAWPKKSPVHYAKGTPQTFRLIIILYLKALSTPWNKGSSHLSFIVLVRYRSSNIKVTFEDGSPKIQISSKLTLLL